MYYACSSVCNGTCASCHYFADAGNTPPLVLGDLVKKVSRASLAAALEKISGKYQGVTVNTSSGGSERVLIMPDGRKISIAPDAGGVPSPAKARDPAIDAELKTLGKYKGGK